MTSPWLFYWNWTIHLIFSNCFLS